MYFKFRACVKQSTQSPLNTHVSLRPWPLCFVHMCCHSVTHHGCMREKFVIWKQKLWCWWKERKPIWGIWMGSISWKGPVMSEFWLDSVFPLGFHFSTQKVVLLCCHWRTIIDIYIWVLMVWPLAFIHKCLPVTLRKQCFLYRKGSETWGMGVLVYLPDLCIVCQGLEGVFILFTKTHCRLFRE